MVSKELFDAIRTDFVESQELLELAEFHRPDMEFVCHHNSYLVAGYLHRQGYGNLHWVTGYYQCYATEKRIHHSWIKMVQNGKTIAVLELDACQLHEAGGYENDPMPSGYIPELSTSYSGATCIVDPDQVELSEDAKESPWVVPSRDVISRYVEFKEAMPEIDFDDLDELGREVSEEFETFRELLAEDGME